MVRVHRREGADSWLLVRGGSSEGGGTAAAAMKMEAARMEDRGVEARRNCGEDGRDGGASRWLL